MIVSKKPVVTVVHSLPGRVRARLSVAPRDVQRMLGGVREHPGMESISFSPITRSILARFNPREISQEEIVLRIAFYLSLDCDSAAVRLLAEPEQRPALGGSAAVSAAALVLSLAMHGLKTANGSPTRWDWLAGLGTAWAVVDHARKELRERGRFDPEVLSLAYLVTAFVRGNFLTASVVTWLASFGRHLLAIPPSGVQVRPVEVRGRAAGQFRYEVLIGPDLDAPERVRVLSALQGLLKYAMTGGGAHPFRTLLEELRDVSKVHGEVLEGFGRMPQGIPMRFN
ncbi:MAG: hypothetical protein ACLQNE_19405 [Thermoguttaceae bacterium]